MSFTFKVSKGHIEENVLIKLILFALLNKTVVRNKPGIWKTVSCFLHGNAGTSGYFTGCLMVLSVVTLVPRAQTGLLYQKGKYFRKNSSSFFFFLILWVFLKLLFFTDKVELL